MPRTTRPFRIGDRVLVHELGSRGIISGMDCHGLVVKLDEVGCGPDAFQTDRPSKTLTFIAHFTPFKTTITKSEGHQHDRA